MTIIITIAAAAAFGLAGETDRSTGEGSAHPVTQVAPAEARSEAEARAFMQLLDAGKTRESYAATTAPFRETTKFKMWELGVMLNRLKGGAQRRTPTEAERDDAPVSSPYPSLEILTFETVMLNGERRSERIVMGRENGRWRVAKVDITYPDEE